MGLQRLAAYTIGFFFALAAFFRIAINFIFNPKIFRKVKRSAPACLTDKSLGEHNYIRTASNIKIHYVSKGVQNKPLVLFVHGFPEFWYSWRHQLQGLELDDYMLVAMDMRGYGDTDKPEGLEHYDVNLLAKDIKELIDALGYSSCVLVSHDWGGALAWRVAHEYPEVIDKFISLNAPHPKIFGKFLQKSKDQKRKSWYLMFFQIPYIPELCFHINDMQIFKDIFIGNSKTQNKLIPNCTVLFKDMRLKNPQRITDEDIEAMKYTFGKPGAMTPPLNYYRNIFISKPPSRPWVKKISAPVLVIWGTADGALSEGLLDGLEEIAEDLTVRKIVGASHWIQQDEPDLVNEYIREFLTRK